MREKLLTVEPEWTQHPEIEAPGGPFIAGAPVGTSCQRCTDELVAAGQAFDAAFEARDHERFLSFFINENATGLGADGTLGMNTQAWGRVLYEYFVEPSWTMKVTPLKTVVQNCVSGQILEVVRFEAPAFGHLTFVHATCWVRDHGEWKLVLQTEGGPLETRNAAAS